MDRGVPRWPLAVIGGLSLAGVLAVGLWNLSLPYYAFSDGPVGDALEAVVVEQVDVYPADGSLLLLTVSSQEVNPYEALIAAFDPSVDLVPREAVRPPDESDSEFTQRNLEAMDNSKEVAIGVGLQRAGYQLEFESDGVRIAALVEGTPASRVLEVGDLIDSVNGVPVRFSEDVAEALEGRSIGDVIEIAVNREGSQVVFPIELVAHISDATRPMIGITAETVNLRPGRPPFPIDIESGLIGGPSAGMMYSSLSGISSM